MSQVFYVVVLSKKNKINMSLKIKQLSSLQSSEAGGRLISNYKSHYVLFTAYISV